MPAPIIRSTEPVPGVRHGTTHGYDKGKCGCDRCRAAKRAARAKQMRNKQHAVVTGYDPNEVIDSDAVVAHVRALMARPLPAAQIAAASGLSLSTIIRFRDGFSTARRETVDAILGVTYEACVSRAPTVPAPVVAAHLNTLLASGPGDRYTKITPKGISRAVGVADGTIYSIVNGTWSKVDAEIADRILALTPDDCIEQTWKVPAARAIQRIRSLQALGYPGPWLSKQLGGPGHHLPAFVQRRDESIPRTLDEQVAALYARIGDTPATPANCGYPAGQIKRSKTIATSHGYHVPACYDDDTGEFMGGAVTGGRRIEPHLTPEERAERDAKVMELTRVGLSAKQIAERFTQEGRVITERTVVRIRSRHAEEHTRAA
jgi:hypothetical protein